MKIRKFTAQNTQDAIAKVKLELGGEALIINTKKVRQKGLAGYFKKPLFEVTAAIDEQAQAKAKRLANHVREYGEKNPPAGTRDNPPAPGAQNDVFSQFQTQLKSSGILPGVGAAPEANPAASGHSGVAPEANPAASGRPGPPPERSEFIPAAPAAAAASAAYAATKPPTARQHDQRLVDSAQDERISQLEIHIANIEGMLSKVYREVSVASKMVETGDEQLEPLTKVLRLFYNNLVRNDVDPEFSIKIVEKVGEMLQSEENACDAATALYNEVASMLGKPETINIRRDKKPTVAIFVGPTGVGKTTTLAKIAADSALNRELDVAMITADTYRIAAVQQLKTYAEILGIPVSVVYTPGEIKNSIAEYADKDLILIDTAGRSHRNRVQFEELRELVKQTEADEIFLVLSTTTSVKNSREIIKNYDFLDDFKLIFTKADETPVFGSMLNARMLTGKRLSYVTVGQSVPDDIEIASVDRIARNLIGSIAE